MAIGLSSVLVVMVMAMAMAMVFVGVGAEKGAGATSGGPKLSLPRALLPLPVRAAAPPALTLLVTGAASCYSWSSSRDDIVNVVPLENPSGCSTSARVSSVPHLTYRQTAIVFAQDVHTKQILRCDVIVDKITSLEVVTTTRELFVEEAPEAFEVRAYDDQGNEFTSLDGVEFSWTVVSPLKNNDVIRIMTFSESQYEASSALQDLESRGLRGHTALLEGVSTGSAKVIVKLPQPEYSSVNSVEVTIRVVANLLVIPSDVSVQLRDSVNFKIIQVREGRLVELPQPSSQYWLDIENDNIADLNKNTGIAVGVTMGSTHVFLRDAGEGLDGENDGVRPPEANIRVVAPFSIKLELRPSSGPSPWSVQNGDLFTLFVYLMDVQDRRIHIGPETRVGLELDESLIDVKWRSINGTVLTGKAQHIGIVSITATLLSVAGTSILPKISASGELQIFDKIEIIPSKSILPWEPNYNTRHEIRLNAIGGDGTYVWHADGSATVDAHSGLVTAISPGKAKITASMASNPQINGIASVLVVEPARMEVVWYEAEGPVGSNLAIHIALFTEIPPNSEKYLPYNKCDLIHFKIVSMEGIYFDMAESETKKEEKLKGFACTVLRVKCSDVGSGLVAVRWGQLEVVLSLGCYAPLQRLYPPSSHESVLLTVGSSLNVIFSGGPVSWFGNEMDIRKEIKNSNQEIAKIVSYPTSNNFHVYTVTCLELGETDAHLKIFGSNKGIDMSEASVAEAIVKISCSNPAAFKLIPKQNIGTLCPVSSSQTSILNGEGSVEVEIVVVDAEGRSFHNASSIRVRWSSKPSAILSDVAVERFLTKLDQQYNVPVVDYHYQMLAMSGSETFNRTNSIEINLEALGFRGTVLKTAGIHHHPSWTNLPHASLSLRLTAAVHASMNKVLIYNHPDNLVHLSLSHGSGSFQINLSNEDCARVTLDHSNGRSLKIQPLSDGDVTISVVDLCMNSVSPTIHISVVSVVNIIADMPELIEKGQSVDCLVRFYDRAGLILPIHADGAPTLTAKINEGRIKVNPSTNKSDDAFIYTVQGLEVSDATIEFTAGKAKTTVSTHVFAPLKVVPRSSVLLPGGSVTLKVIGGPPPPATIRFHKSTAPFDIIDVTGSGVVSGLSTGSAGVEACADGLRGGELACASASVRVLPLESVAIYAPTSTLLTGNTMPLWVTGLPDSLTPIELGSLKSSLHFRWSLSGDGSATVHDILGSTGIEFDDTDRVSIRLTAVHPGSVIVHLNVTAMEGSVLSKISSSSWYARFDFTIIEPLRMKNPMIEVTPLLLAPHSTISLETNYQHDNLVYSIKEDDNKFSDGDPLVKITSEGKLTTFGRLGRAILTINSIDSEVWSKQHIILSLEVCAPHYAMVELWEGAVFNKLNGLAALPMGLTLPLTMSKFDVLGRKFSTVTQNIRHLTNRPDLISVVTNSTQTIELLMADSGGGVVKIWDPNSEKQFSDYISLTIQTALYPQKILATVGDIWCMRSAVKGAMWTESLDGAVWAGDMGLSQARVSNVAATSLVLHAPNGLPYVAHATVLIRPADVIYFIGDAHVVTEEKPYIVHLVLANHEEQNKFNNILLEERDCLSEDITYFPFSCQIKYNDEVSNVLATPVFDRVKGAYGCEISWSQELSFSNIINASQSVIVVAHSGSISTDPLTVRLVQSAKIQPEIIVLSPPPASAASVDVAASKEVLKQLTVVPKDDVLKVEGPLHLTDTTVRYIVRGDSNSYGPRKASILLISPLTHQNSEFVVNINGGSSSLDEKCAAGGYSPILQFIQGYQPLLLAMITFIIILVASVYIYGNIVYPLQIRKKEYSTVPQGNDVNSQIRSMSYQSRSPLSRNTSDMSFSPSSNSLSMHYSPSSPNLDSSNSAVYGDPSYLVSAELRRNRRFL